MMKTAALLLVVCIGSPGFAQQTPSATATEPRFDAGQYANDTYSNECLGFSFHMPAGWLAKSQGISGLARAIHQQGGGLGLLMIEHPKRGTFGDTITLYATEATEKHSDAKDFVGNAVHAQVKRAPGKTELLRDASAAESGGKTFYRADYKAVLPYGPSAYRSFVFTRFRNYFIGEMISAGSQEELNSAAESLKGFSFREDVPNPSCVK